MASSLCLALLCIFASFALVFSKGSIGVPTEPQGIVKLKQTYPHGNASLLNGVFKYPPGPYGEAPYFNMKACPPLSPPPPATNVSTLRPGNIKVVMAMGDSITAAMSAKDTSLFSLKEYRGLSFSIGGDSGVTTMPNILGTYADLIGTSTGIGERDMKTNGLNGAISGAINIDLLGQAEWLVSQLRANPSIDFHNDWKLLTLWIGSNNLCDVCDDEGDNDANNYQKYVTEALDYLYINVPRVFVNLLSNLEITQLANINGGACSLIHTFACNCVSSSSKRNDVKVANLEYQIRAYSIAARYAERNNPEFTVVVQPFLEQTTITERDELSAADCFHPSAISHSVAAVALWNNMITPVSQKKHSWNLDDTPICPTADTLLYTY